MKKSYLISVIVAIVFFILVYAILDIHFLIALFLAFGAYFGVFLILKNLKENEVQEVIQPKEKNLGEKEIKMMQLRKLTADLYEFAINVQNQELSTLLKDLSAKSEDIEKMETNSVVIQSQIVLLLDYFLNSAYDTIKGYMNTLKYHPQEAEAELKRTTRIETEIKASLQKFIEYKQRYELMDVETEIKNFKERMKTF